MRVWRFKCSECLTVVTVEFPLEGAAEHFLKDILMTCPGCSRNDTLYEPEPPPVDFLRADGRVICDRCKQPYSNHPFDTEAIGWEHRVYLHILCDGRRVKL